MKLTLDISLLLLFGAMCNTRVTGTAFHEIAGLVYAALVVLHLALNRKWLGVAFKGKLRGKRAVTLSLVNIALAVALAVILFTGVKASHFLFPTMDKAPEYLLAVHAICGVAAAGLVLIHVLLHVKSITRNKLPRKLALAAVLTVVIGYSLIGTTQGALKWMEDKNSKPGFEQHDKVNGEDIRAPKDGERK